METLFKVVGSKHARPLHSSDKTIITVVLQIINSIYCHIYTTFATAAPIMEGRIVMQRVIIKKALFLASAPLITNDKKKIIKKIPAPVSIPFKIFLSQLIFELTKPPIKQLRPTIAFAMNQTTPLDNLNLYAITEAITENIK